jgi:peroxiredoxin/predicted 2-oxoglutarate/Fe(II)-dependent dioxygenase YbiX
MLVDGSLCGLKMPTYALLTPGDPAPSVMQRNSSNDRYNLDLAAGRTLVLCFFASSTTPHAAAVLAAVKKRRDLFDDVHAAFFGVTHDRDDEAKRRVDTIMPGYRFFWDHDDLIARAYGVAPAEGEDGLYLNRWVIINPMMRITAVIPFRQDQTDIAQALDHIARLPRAGRVAGLDVQAPVIVLDNIFDPDTCRRLIASYDAADRDLSGVMREIGGRTRLVLDDNHKRRRDHMIEDENERKFVTALIRRRIVPQIEKIHQFHATRIERYLVACYAAEDAAHFRPHRDNTTKGTAHRRFAVSINLSDDFDGGEIQFPEYGSRGFRALAGGAVVFSCSLLHAVTQVTRGRRYAFLPFLYDDAAAAIREQNKQFLDTP